MGRRIDKLVAGPPGICDACGASCCTLDQVGLVCYRCRGGVFIHRRFWLFATCPACGGDGVSTCATCCGSGVSARPREDIDVADLRAEWRALPQRYAGAVPPVIATRVAWADEEECPGRRLTP